jgi:hypothetical protein
VGACGGLISLGLYICRLASNLFEGSSSGVGKPTNGTMLLCKLDKIFFPYPYYHQSFEAPYALSSCISKNMHVLGRNGKLKK